MSLTYWNNVNLGLRNALIHATGFLPQQANVFSSAGACMNELYSIFH